MHIIGNAYHRDLEFELPPRAAGRPPWRRLIDTALASPDDIRAPDEAPELPEDVYRVHAHSVVLLTRPMPD